MSFVAVQLVLSSLALISSLALLTHLLLKAPWGGGAKKGLQLRLCLVLAITLFDTLYGGVHLLAALLSLAHDHSDDHTMRHSKLVCAILGPVTYWVIFSLYVWVAILAHYRCSTTLAHLY